MNYYELSESGQTCNSDPRLLQIHSSPSDKMTNPQKFMDICHLRRKVEEKTCSNSHVGTCGMSPRCRLEMLSRLSNPCL